MLLSSTWTATSLKLTRTKLEQIKRWKCQWGKKKKTWRSATTRFVHGCLLALLFRFTYFKTCVSKGKHSHSQAFSIDHLSMQAVWPGTNRFFTFPIYFVTIQPSVSNFTWKVFYRTQTFNRSVIFRICTYKIWLSKIKIIQPKMTPKKKWGYVPCLFSFSTPCVILNRY